MICVVAVGVVKWHWSSHFHSLDPRQQNDAVRNGW